MSLSGLNVINFTQNQNLNHSNTTTFVKIKDKNDYLFPSLNNTGYFSIVKLATD